MIISIGRRDIGEDQPCYIIAEIGLNHNGSVDIARDLIDEAAQVVSAEAAAEAARQIRTASLKMIEKMGALQVDLYKCLQQQQRHMQRSPILDFDTAADRLAAVQEILENDGEIVSRSKVPRGRRIGGFIDDTNTVTSLGSSVRDWARQEALG